jgi:hypothetical protein
MVVNTFELERTLPLYSTLLADPRFHELLLTFDRDLADAVRRGGCIWCGGPVHASPYQRKPRGRSLRLRLTLGAEHDQRFSFCCAIDGCRKRKMPPSLRFLGRTVYLAAIVVVIAIMQHGISERRMRRLTEAIDVDRRTVARWRVWWREVFTATPFWRMARAAFMPPVDENRLPAALIERFAGEAAERLIALLRFLSPISGGQVQAR